MTEADKIIAAIEKLSDEQTARAFHFDQMGDARKVRAYVVTLLIQTQPSDPQTTIRKAKAICDFIETGKTIDAV